MAELDEMFKGEIRGYRRKRYIDIALRLDDDRIFEILEENDIKPSQAKVNKLKKLFAEVESDFEGQVEESLEEFLVDLAEEEWGE
jgi:hypothetical protein